MDKNENNRFAAIHYSVGLILFAVVFWDIYGIKVDGWTYYYHFKIPVISSYFIMGYLNQKNRLEGRIGFMISCLIFYIYSYVCLTYLHPTYVFSFYEGLVLISLFYKGSFKSYALITTFGMILAALGIQMMPEPDFVKEGASVRHHLQTITMVFGVLAVIFFWFFNRQREIIYIKDQKFASIGRQSAFLLHELKSPLSRFIAKSSEKDNPDADYIFSIIEGVELLITKKENLTFGKLNWNEIGTYLSKEFGPVCQHYKIQFEISGFDGDGFGHRSTIKLALKNLIKNAVEAIVSEGTSGIIRVTRFENIIEVSNNGSVISKDKIEQLFKPFYSGKKTRSNHGIGLHFVDSVVKAHNGNIGVQVEGGWNIFKITLGSLS